MIYQMGKLKTLACVDCGELITTRAPNRIRCSECQTKREKQRTYMHMSRNRERRKTNVINKIKDIYIQEHKQDNDKLMKEIKKVIDNYMR